MRRFIIPTKGNIISTSKPILSLSSSSTSLTTPFNSLSNLGSFSGINYGSRYASSIPNTTNITSSHTGQSLSSSLSSLSIIPHHTFSTTSSLSSATTSSSTTTKSTSSSSVPPPGSRAAAVLNAAVTGTYDANMLKEDMQRSATTLSSSSATYPTTTILTNNPYVPNREYTGNYYTSKTNPIEHDWAQAGRYYDLGNKDEINKIFPQGVAGDIPQEWSVTGINSCLIRPLGVQMIKHLESWRQSYGRKLAKDGKKVLDIDPSKPFTPISMNPPVTRDNALFATTPASKSKSKNKSPSPPKTEATSEALPLWTKFHPVRVLVGPQGSGKSTLLNYNVHYARSNNWIVLFIQDSYELMNMGKVLVPSKRREGMVDQHDMALKILKEFSAATDSLLAQVPQRGSYAKHRYLPAKLDKTVSAERSKLRDEEEAEKSRLKAQADAAGRAWDPSTFKSVYEDESDTKIDRTTFTLKDMVNWGIAHPSSATDTLLDVLKELKQVTEFPVMIAIDGINELYGPSPYPEAGSGELLPPSRLSIPAALQCLGSEGFKPESALKRGLWLTNVSFKHSQNMNEMFNNVSVRGRLRVPVPSLSRQEIYSTLNYFVKTNSFLMLDGVKTVDPFLVEYYRMLTDGNPKDMFMAAIFTPDVPKGPRPRNYRDREGY